MMMKNQKAWLRICGGALVLSGLLTGPAAQAQKKFVQKFTQGAVLLTTGDTLRGAVELHHSLNAVVVRAADGRTRSVGGASIQLLAVRGELLAVSGIELISVASTPPEYAPGRVGSRPRNPAGLPPRNLMSYDNTGLPPSRPCGQWVGPTEIAVDTVSLRIYRPCKPGFAAPAAGRLYPGFYEQLTNGPWMLLRQQQLVSYSTVPDPAHACLVQQPLTKDVFYLAGAGGRLTLLAKPEPDLLRISGPQANQVAQYAQAQGLAYKSAPDLAALVTYLNGLLAPAEN